jgi:group I intron endonuclease
VLRSKIYLNADKDKLDILKENKGKSGIYLWENIENGKIYIGSSINLSRRLTSYYNLKHLAKYPTRYINNALLKGGYSAFALHILEYCDKEDLIKREQYYFDLLKPNYNICSTAGSTLGRLHLKDSKEKISASKLNTNLEKDNHFYGKTHTEEAKLKMRESKLSKTISNKTKEKISVTMTGRKFTEEHKTNLSLAKKNSKIISVLNLETKEETNYTSISQAERSLGFPKGSISDNLKSKSGNPYRGIYKFTVEDKR